MAQEDGVMGEARQAAQDAARAARGYAVDEVLGKRQWQRSKVGWLTGAGVARDTVGILRDQGKEAGGRIKTLWGHAFPDRSQGVSIDPDIEATDARFREAMRVNGKSLSDVNRSVDNTFRQFWLFAGLTGFSLLVAFWLVGSMLLAGSVSLLGIVFAFLPVPLVGPLALRAGYTNWMFRRRRLDGIGDYLRSGQILPTKAPPMPRSVAVRPGRTNTTVLSLVAGLLLLGGVAAMGGAQPAHAADDPSTTSATQSTDPASLAQQVTSAPSSTDLFVKMLGVVIPNVGPIPNGDYGSNNPTATATKQALGIFAGVLLFLGVTVNGYQILTGLVASAKEGKALGDRYHEVWAPLRVVVGYGFLVPVIGGLCAAQVLVLYLVVWGGNMANIVWTSYADNLVSQYTMGSDSGTNSSDSRNKEHQAVAAQVAMDQGAAIVRRVAQKSLCLATARAEMKSRGGAVAQNVGTNTPSWQDIPGFWPFRDETYQALFADGSTSADDGSYQNALIDCGRVTSTIHPVKSGQNTTAVQNDLDKTSATAIGAVISAVYPEMSKYAQTYVASGGSSPPAFGPNGNASTTILTQAITNYAQAMTDEAKNLYTQSDVTQGASSQLSSVKQTIHDEGWAASGTFYLTLSRLSAAMYSALDQQSAGDTANDDVTSIKDPVLHDVLYGSRSKAGALTAFDGWYKSHMGDVKFNNGTSTDNYVSKDKMSDVASSFASSTPTTGLLSPLFMWVLRFADNQLDTNPFMAMQRLTDMGNWFIWTGGGIWVLVGGISGVGNGLQHNGAGALGFVGSLSGYIGAGATNFLSYALGGAITNIATLGSYAAIGIMGAGILHAYILPMIPYVMVTFFVMGMLVLVVESLVAAPLWAFFHIRMDGQEFVDQVQRPGYMIAFNLLLRPTLMVFGLILSNGIFGAMVFFTSHTFYPTISALNASNNLGPIGVVTLIVLMAYVHFQLAIRSFTLINQLPDRVSRWFGNGSDLGEESHAGQTTAFVAGEVKSGTSNALGAANNRKFGGSKSPGKGPDGGKLPGTDKEGPGGGDASRANNGGGALVSSADKSAPSGESSGPSKSSGNVQSAREGA